MPLPRSSGLTMTAPSQATASYVVVVRTPTTRPFDSAAKHPSGESASNRRKSARVYPQCSRSVRAMAESMSRLVSRRTFAASRSSPAARAPRTRRPPARTTCRSPCTGASAAAAPGVPLHAPKRVLRSFDLREFFEGGDLVRVQVLPSAEGPGVRLGEVHVEDVAGLDLSADRDPVDGDRDLLSRARSVEALLAAPDRLDPTEGPSVFPHERFPAPDAPGEDAHAEDRGLRGPEDVVRQEQ